MAAFNKFNTFVADIANKVHQLNSDVLKVALSDVAPTAGNTVLANITQITAANGYPSGGNAATLTSSSQSGGVYKLILVDTVFTASGGSIAQFRYVVLYNSTAVGGPLIGWYDFGSEVNITVGNTFTVDFDGVNGVLTIT
jgi:hypothetical protein